MNKNQRGKYLLKNTIIFAIGNFATKFISFFLVPLYTNVLSTAEYGTVDLIFTISSVLVPVFTFNVAEAILRFALDEDADNSKIMSVAILACILIIIFGGVMFPILNRVDSLKTYSLYFYGYLVTFAISQILLTALRGKKMLLKYSIGNIIYTISVAIMNIVFLVIYKLGINGYLIAYIISNIISAIYAFVLGNIGRDLRHFTIDVSLMIKMFKYSVFLIPTSFMWWIINSSDRVMITNILGTSANGIYAISYKIPTLISTITTIFTQAWMYSAINEKDSVDNEEYTNNIYSILFAGVIIVASGLLMIIKPFLKVYVSEEYFIAWKYTPFLMLGFAFLTLSTFISTSYNVHKDSKGFLFSGMTGAIINIILNYILIPFWGINGASIATCISYISVFIYRWIDTQKYVNIKINKIQILAIILLTIIAFTVYITGYIGQILLIIEFCIVLVLFKNVWMTLLNNLIIILKKKITKEKT